MRIERLTYNKIKIFLTTDDLSERGLTKEDIWKDSLKWHQLFHDMLEDVSDEFGVSIEGSVAVEIFSVQAQGMIMIVTMDEEDEESLNEGFIDMAVTTKSYDDILLELDNIEHVIQLAQKLSLNHVSGGSLYVKDEQYFLHYTGEMIEEKPEITAIMAEYGSFSLASIHWVAEYGKKIMEHNAIETLIKYFK